MTTNVVDEIAKVVASDSRWSFEVLDALGHYHATIFVDDTEFDKIEYAPDHSFVFAGPADLIAAWKGWARSPARNWKNNPGVRLDFAICIIDMADKKVGVEHGQRIVGSDHRFAGTGAVHAYQCWSVNKDATRCVKSAAAADILTGGTVRALDLASGKHNLGNVCDHRSVNAEVMKRGMVMFSSGKAIPIDDAIKGGDPFIQKAASEIAKGNLSAEAPAGRDHVVWTDLDVERLTDALRERFPEK